MSRRLLAILVGLLLLAVPLGSAYAYETFRGYSGVVIYDKANAKTAYTLWAGFNETVSYLMDLQGNIVNQWKLAELIPFSNCQTMVLPNGQTRIVGPPLDDPNYFDGVQICQLVATTPGLHDRLLANGHLLRGYKPDTFDYNAPAEAAANVDAYNKVNYSPAGGAGGGVLELDWEGNLLWWYPIKDATHLQHHTFYRVEDTNSPYYGHTFILAWEFIDPTAAQQAGRDPGTIGAGSSRLAAGLYPDFIREVDENKNTVWEWRTWDHITTTLTDPYKFYINAQDDENNEGYADWTHANTVEFNPVTDQVIINFRNWGEFFVIDHAATFDADCLTDAGGPTCDAYTLAASAAGDITFRWGNPCNYGAGECPYFLHDGDQVTFGEHCVVWLGVDYQNYQGTPGNILIFDNGWERPEGNRSSAVEMTPVGIGGNPQDWLTTINGGSSNQIWRFSAANESSFYTAFQGGAERVYQDDATGEMYTFVTSTGEGNLFQVHTYYTEDIFGNPTIQHNDVVWNFIAPVEKADGTRACYQNDGQNNMIHRAHQYLPDYPGLAGKTLKVTPFTENIVGSCARAYLQWDAPGAQVEARPLTGWGFSGLGIGGGGGGGGGAGGGGGGY